MTQLEVMRPGPPDIPVLRKKERERRGAGIPWSSASAGSGLTILRAPVAEASKGRLGLKALAGRIAGLLGRRGVPRARVASKGGLGLVLGALAAAGGVAGYMKTFSAPAPVPPAQARAGGADMAGADGSQGAGGGAGSGAFAAGDAAGGSAGPSAKGAADAQGSRGANGAAGEEGAADAARAAAASGPGRFASAPAGTGSDAAMTARVTMQDASSMPGAGSASDPQTMAAPAAMGVAVVMQNPMRMATARGGGRGVPSAEGHAGLKGYPWKHYPQVGGINSSGVRSRAAMGALKWARRSSLQGKTLASTSEAAARYEKNAFEMTRTDGGVLTTVGGPSESGFPDVVAPMGGSGNTLNDGAQAAPDPGTSQDVTPYQSQIDHAKSLTNSARKNHNLGMAMIIIGSILIALGAALMMFGPLGAALLAAGMMLTSQGMMELAIAQNQANQADRLGRHVQQDYEQRGQGKIVSDCARQGGQGKRCRPGPFPYPADEIPPAVQQEANQTYSVGQ